MKCKKEERSDRLDQAERPAEVLHDEALVQDWLVMMHAVHRGIKLELHFDTDVASLHVL